jgi:hypothetical protein
MRDYVRLLFVLLVFAACSYFVSQVRAAVPDSVTRGVQASLEANFAACNAEDMKALLRTTSREMPNRALFVETVRAEWAAQDTYTQLVDVEVLEHCDAPYANCRLPYATAWVTQRTVQMTSDNIQAAPRCVNGRCRDEDLAHLFAVSPQYETVRYLALFKKEGGAWKGVANLTEPEPVESFAEAEEDLAE